MAEYLLGHQIISHVNAGRILKLMMLKLYGLKLEQRTKSSFCVFYTGRPPNSDDSLWENLQGNVDIVKQTYNSKIMLIGDLNADSKTRQGS
jgi:hypothetical protein